MFLNREPHPQARGLRRRPSELRQTVVPSSGDGPAAPLDKFSDNAQQDIYRCPMGASLTPKRREFCPGWCSTSMSRR